MRNIVLITIDALRADHCSFMGYCRETTPTLDEMAREGLYFENAIAPGVATLNSMSGIFTGDYFLGDSSDFRTAREETIRKFRTRETLAKALSQIGFSTGAFTPNAYTSRYFGFDKGFNDFHDLSIEHRNKDFKQSVVQMIERFIPEQKRRTNVASIRYLILKEKACKPWENYYDQILNWVKKIDKPFFLWIHLLATHHPYLTPRKFRKWGNWFDMYLYSWKVRAANWHPTLSEEDREKLINTYDDSILYADAFVNKLHKDLRNEDPIFVIHADHGDGFGEHGFYGHNQNALYEELIHVPLVIYNGNVKGKVEMPFSLLDLHPTILVLIQNENKPATKSFLHDSKDWVISKVFDQNGRKLAVRTKNWKFITGQNETDELYHLKEDPQEQENLSSKHSDLAKEMRKIADSHVKQEAEKRKVKEKISRIAI